MKWLKASASSHKGLFHEIELRIFISNATSPVHCWIVQLIHHHKAVPMKQNRVCYNKTELVIMPGKILLAGKQKWFRWVQVSERSDRNLFEH